MADEDHRHSRPDPARRGGCGSGAHQAGRRGGVDRPALRPGDGNGGGRGCGRDLRTGTTGPVCEGAEAALGAGHRFGCGWLSLPGLRRQRRAAHEREGAGRRAPGRSRLRPVAHADPAARYRSSTGSGQLGASGRDAQAGGRADRHDHGHLRSWRYGTGDRAARGGVRYALHRGGPRPGAAGSGGGDSPWPRAAAGWSMPPKR